MNKIIYKELLKDKKWLDKRQEVLKRDLYKCTKCNSKKCLQVHHTYYIYGKNPWNYPISSLITLCSKCHIKEHKNNKIPFQKSHKNEIKTETIKLNKIVKPFKLDKLSKKLDKKIYDKIFGKE